MDNCNICSPASTCTSCNSGYTLITVNSVTYCVIQCTSGQVNIGNSTNPNCQSCSSANSNCISCTSSNNAVVCTGCKNKYIVDGSGACQLCSDVISNCRLCSDATTCT